jgi:hypothetical protein
MTEHIKFAGFSCENTQNTWNTYFCKKSWRKAASTADHEERVGDYIREHMFYVFHVFLSAVCR